jgi:hypothetical protein
MLHGTCVLLTQPLVRLACGKRQAGHRGWGSGWGMWRVPGATACVHRAAHEPASCCCCRDIKPLSIALPEPQQQPPPPAACTSSCSVASGITVGTAAGSNGMPGTASATPRSLRQESSTAAGAAAEPAVHCQYPEGFCSSSDAGSMQLQLLWRWHCPAVQGRCVGGAAWQPGILHPLLAAGCWLLAAGCWLLAAGCRVSLNTSKPVASEVALLPG